MSKYCIIGNGLLATALKERLKDYTWYPTKDTKYVLYFSGVKHMDFENNPRWHGENGILEFNSILGYCVRHNIKLIYPSSALVYEKDIDFKDFKLEMEETALRYSNTLGLRIFPVYGKGSSTVISQWCEDIKNNRQPVVWGNGEQKRDFIYIDDFVDQVISCLDKEGIIDIGTGNPVSFNEIVKTINEVLNKDIKPIYVKAPEGYSEGIFCKEPLKINTTLKGGIKKICEV